MDIIVLSICGILLILIIFLVYRYWQDSKRLSEQIKLNTSNIRAIQSLLSNAVSPHVPLDVIEEERELRRQNDDVSFNTNVMLGNNTNNETEYHLETISEVSVESEVDSDIETEGKTELNNEINDLTDELVNDIENINITEDSSKKVYDKLENTDMKVEEVDNIVEEALNSEVMVTKSKKKIPESKAKDFDVGYQDEGNDGNMYVVYEAKNGVKRWKKLK